MRGLSKLRARRPSGAEPGISPEADEGPERRAEKYALDLLGRRPRTVSDVATRLRARGCPEPVTAGLVARLQSAGYLDDRRFARSWVEERSRSKPCGAARLGRELILKGVPAEVVSDVLAAEMTPRVEEELAVRAARRKSGPDGPRPGPETRKLWDFLRRRGFGACACRAALAAVTGLPPDGDECPP